MIGKQIAIWVPFMRPHKELPILPPGKVISIALETTVILYDS